MARPWSAARWFRRAAAQNLAVAMANLARAYQTGRGVPADPAEARRWQALAAAHDYHAATAPEAPVDNDLLSVTGTPVSTTGHDAATANRPAAR